MSETQQGAEKPPTGAIQIWVGGALLVVAMIVLVVPFSDTANKLGILGVLWALFGSGVTTLVTGLNKRRHYLNR